MKKMLMALSVVLSSVAQAEYLGSFAAAGYDDVSVYKEHSKLIMRTEPLSGSSVTEVYTILPNEDDYLFGSAGPRSKINGIVVEVLGQSTEYDGLLKTTYVNSAPTTSVLYLPKYVTCERR